MGYNTLFWGSEDDFDGLWPPVDGYFNVVHTRRFEHFWSFSWAITPCFVVRGRFRWSVILGRRLFDAVKTRRFEHLDVGGRFSCPLTPGTRLFGCCQNSSFRAFFAVFVGYNTLFCGPGTISMARYHQYTTIWTLSKLVVSSISGCFRGLQHFVFRVRGRF